MTLLTMLCREIAHRKMSFALGCLGILLAAGSFIHATGLLSAHETRARAQIAEKELESQTKLKALDKEMRKATLKLGFNLVILPEGQELRDWHAQDYAGKTMPEEYVTTLADSGIVTVRHFLPSLQQRIVWPEQNRTVILMGTRGEVPNLHKNPKKPLVQPVPEGAIVLGYELHHSLGLTVGNKVTLMGQEFTVSRCHEKRGSKDDITIWIHLTQAQQLLERPGRINAIIALECLCAETNALPRIRRDIAQILPGTQVMEMGSKALARAEARLGLAEQSRLMLEQEKQHHARLQVERERRASIAIPLIMLAAVAWVASLMVGNVRRRRHEIGILGATGFRFGQVLRLVVMKAVAMGVVGGALGILLGTWTGMQACLRLSPGISRPEALAIVLDGQLALAVLVAATLLAVVAGWIPALLAARQDPAEVIGRDRPA